MKQANSFTSSTSSFSASTLSIPSALAQSTNPGAVDSVFEELVSKLFCCRILVISTESAQQFTNQYFDGIGLVDIFNQLSQLSNLNCEYWSVVCAVHSLTYLFAFLEQQSFVI